MDRYPLRRVSDIGIALTISQLFEKGLVFCAIPILNLPRP